MSATLAPDLLARLGGWATAEFGLRFPPDRWSELARGVASAALELGIPDYAGWAEQMLAGPAPADHVATLANHLTISETYFFRQRETFVALEKDILPQRIEERRRQAQVLRLWSAGCASGEEPYSLAILLRQRFPELRPERVAISGTDLNSRVLARAERGLYSEWSFRDVPEWVKSAWFSRRPGGRYEIAPEIRAMVRFQPLNFAAPRYPAEFGERGDFDVILCRNVLMYFSADWQQAIVRRLVEALAMGGWLIVGPCDLTAAQSVALHLQLVQPGVYRKASALASRVPVLPALFSLPPVALAPEPEVFLPIPPAVPVAPTPAEPRVPAPALTPAATENDVASAVAQAHADRGELAQALAACDQALAHDNTHAAFHYLRACILQELDRPAEAADAFRRVLFLDPGSVMAEFALGCLAERGGQHNRARHHFHVVLRLLGSARRGAAVPGSDGLTVARLRAFVENNLGHDAA